MTGTLVSIDGWTLLPVLGPALGAVLVLLLDVLAPKARALTRATAAVALLVGLGGAVVQGLTTDASSRLTLCLPAPVGRCFYDPSSTGALLQAGALFSGVVVLLLLWQHSPDGEPMQLGGPAVTHALLLTTVAGAVTVAAATDLGTWLVALELATLPVVALVALRGTPDANHGALSLLLMALVSVGLLVVGAALWVVATHDVTFSRAAAHTAWGQPPTRAALLLSVLFLLAGLGFKLSAVPFHTWTPQAYAGSSAPVAALLATVSKIAAVGGVVVVLRAVGGVVGPGMHPHRVVLVVAVLAAVTMTLGNLVALRQDDVVRLLAWSTIAQAGWVILPLTAMRESGLRASTGYVVAYAIATLVAFAVVAVVGRRLSDHVGLLRRHPLLGGALVLGLLSLAGLPPGVLGLVAKVMALRPVMGADLWPLALVAVVNAVIGIAVYLRWVAVLFGAPRESAAPLAVGLSDRVALAVSSTALVLTSVAPQLVLGLMRSVG